MKTKHDPRHQSRRLAVQALFEWSFHKQSTLKQRIEAFIQDYYDDQEEGHPGPREFNQDLFENLVYGVEKNKAQIDEIISECAPEWPLDQVAKVDLSILRISVYEILHYPETPTKVSIDEAVELAKEYGGDNSSRFINGVLGTVVKKYLPESDTISEKEPPLAQGETES